MKDYSRWLQPFSVQSQWNAVPVSPVLGSAGIDLTHNYPFINDTNYGTPLFYAMADDPPQTITSSVPDEIATRAVTVPHWPAGVAPATGTDHACEIYDETTGLLHSFWNLNVTAWTAGHYSCHRLDGLGHGTPSRPAGPAACGAAYMGGRLRVWEHGLPVLNHALRLSLDGGSLTNGPVFPATTEDWGTVYPGIFPMGTRFMLPPAFDVTTISSRSARAIARTLMLYGAILTDTAVGTAAIEGEAPRAWQDANNHADMAAIIGGMRPVVSVSGWLDANGVPFTPQPFSAMQLLSMRGPWGTFGNNGPVTGVFNTVSNLLEFPATTATRIVNQMTIWERANDHTQPCFEWSTSHRWFTNPTPGQAYAISCVGNDPTLRAQMQVKSGDWSTLLADSGSLAPGQSAQITWPSQTGTIAIVLASKYAGTAAGVRLEMVAT